MISLEAVDIPEANPSISTRITGKIMKIVEPGVNIMLDIPSKIAIVGNNTPARVIMVLKVNLALKE